MFNCGVSDTIVNPSADKGSKEPNSIHISIYKKSIFVFYYHCLLENEMLIPLSHCLKWFSRSMVSSNKILIHFTRYLILNSYLGRISLSPSLSHSHSLYPFYFFPNSIFFTLIQSSQRNKSEN